MMPWDEFFHNYLLGDDGEHACDPAVAWNKNGSLLWMSSAALDEQPEYAGEVLWGAGIQALRATNNFKLFGREYSLDNCGSLPVGFFASAVSAQDTPMREKGGLEFAVTGDGNVIVGRYSIAVGQTESECRRCVQRCANELSKCEMMREVEATVVHTEEQRVWLETLIEQDLSWKWLADERKSLLKKKNHWEMFEKLQRWGYTLEQAKIREGKQFAQCIDEGIQSYGQAKRQLESFNELEMQWKNKEAAARIRAKQSAMEAQQVPPQGILVLVSSPDYAQDGSTVLANAIQIMGSYKQGVAAGNKNDELNANLPKGERKDAWNGKVDAFIKAYKVRRQFVHFVTIRGDDMCDWERDFIEDRKFRERYPEVKAITHFASLADLQAYVQKYADILFSI